MATRTAPAQAVSPAKPSIVKVLRQLLRVAGTRSYLLYTSALAGLLMSATAVMSADLTARLTNSMLARDLAAFMNLIVLAVLVRLGQTLLEGLQEYMNGKFGHETIEQLRQGIARRLSKATAEASSQEHSGQTLSRLTNDLGSTQSLLQASVPGFFTGCVQAGFALGYMLWRHWVLALVAVFGAPAVFTIVRRLSGPVMSIAKAGQETLAKANEIVAEGLSGAEMVRSFGLRQTLTESFNKRTGEWLGLMRRYSRMASLAAAVGFGAGFTPFVLIFGIGGYMVLRGDIEMGVLFAFFELLNYVSFPMEQLPRLLTQMAAEGASAQRVLDLLDTPVERQDGADFPPDPRYPAIEFRNVTFTYPGGSHPALSGVSFKVNLGETVAVVGSSGSGKSTLFRLLLGDHNPDEGEVLVFGHPLHEWSLTALRSHFSYVSQTTYLFPFSVRENLKLGDETLGDDRIQAAARLAQADGFIQSLPQGYETPVGELGNRISGGEKQRLSLARALLRPAHVFLLDEATSALDYHAERRVIEGIWNANAAQDMTILVIAHRLSSVQHADRILVLESGRPVESGTHSELMAERGRYYHLYHSEQELDETSTPATPSQGGER
ncbi:MAG TPA: ABC transporter ATP-binding protein [Firmicutes bacterium]|nr:ABC transporter ATP-binding protein [Candidatus Fermentithermobacillaceae bacterium]